jgi:hypothetical protein
LRFEDVLRAEKAYERDFRNEYKALKKLEPKYWSF